LKITDFRFKESFEPDILYGAVDMVRKIIPLLSAIALLLGCGGHPGYKSRKEIREGYSPEILDYYADQVIQPGATWRIYLRFRDSDCDMTYIVADVYQSGVGPLTPSYTPLRQTGCQEIKGYLALNTPAENSLLQDRLEVKVIVRDRRGNRSQPINLTLNFGWMPSEKQPEKWQETASKTLGVMNIDLVSSQSFQRGAGS
jgi:hypothetical protein